MRTPQDIDKFFDDINTLREEYRKYEESNDPLVNMPLVSYMKVCTLSFLAAATEFIHPQAADALDKKIKEITKPYIDRLQNYQSYREFARTRLEDAFNTGTGIMTHFEESARSRLDAEFDAPQNGQTEINILPKNDINTTSAKATHVNKFDQM